MIITDRDRAVLEFLAKWRFCTVEQLQKAGIFHTAYNTCYKRLHLMQKAGLIKAIRLKNGKLVYYLSPGGGEVIGLVDSWHSKRYRCAASTVVNQLVLVDFALAMKVDYLPREKALERFVAASYDALARISRLSDVYYEKDGMLHVLVVDRKLSMKYFQERVKAYSGLPVELRDGLVVVFLVFSEAKKNQVLRLAAGGPVRVKVYKSSWKY